MSNFPENEKQENTEAVSEDASSVNGDEVFSTVFSNPEEKEPEKKVKKKKRLPIVILSVLVPLILLGAVFAVIKFIPKLEDETDDKTVSDIEVVNINVNDLAKVIITNSNGTFTFCSEKAEETVTNENGENETQTVTKWYQEGMDRAYTSSDVIGGAISTLSSVYATREVTGKTAEECGFSEPAGSVEYITADGKSISYTVGGMSPDKSGYYIKVSDTDKIYVVGDTVKTLIEFSQIDIASIETMPGFPKDSIPSIYLSEDGTLSKFDSVTITGKALGEDKLVFKPNTNELTQSFSPYMISSPVSRIAKDAETLMNIFSTGVLPNGAYSLDVSDKSMKEFGLDNPDFKATMEIAGKKFSYIFKKQDDESCAVYCDGWKLIQKAPISALAFINMKSTDFYSPWVALNYIDDIKGLTVKTPEKTYDFTVTAFTDENESTGYDITCNGEKIDTEAFQDFYEDCVGLTASDFIVDDKAESTPSYTFTFTYLDSIGGKNVIEYYKDGASRYQFKSDGRPLGRVNISSLKKVLSSLDKLLAKEN